jgi:hypothetical protein
MLHASPELYSSVYRSPSVRCTTAAATARGRDIRVPARQGAQVDAVPLIVQLQVQNMPAARCTQQYCQNTRCCTHDCVNAQHTIRLHIYQGNLPSLATAHARFCKHTMPNWTHRAMMVPQHYCTLHTPRSTVVPVASHTCKQSTPTQSLNPQRSIHTKHIIRGAGTNSPSHTGSHAHAVAIVMHTQHRKQSPKSAAPTISCCNYCDATCNKLRTSVHPFQTGCIPALSVCKPCSCSPSCCCHSALRHPTQASATCNARS